MTLNDNVTAVVQACAIPQSALTYLTVDVTRLFVDGYAGIEKNKHAKEYQVQKVMDCEACSAGISCGAECIDDDEWSDKVDASVFGKTEESVDILVSIRTRTGVDKLLMVEGKLGSLVNAYTQENYYPTRESLLAKYKWTMARIAGCFPVCRTMLLVVSQDSIAQMRRRLNAYITAGQLPPTALKCPSEFWKMLGVPVASGSVVCGISAKERGGP